MAQDLYHEYSTTGSVSRSDVRDALSGLTDDDITESSPITAGAAEVGVETRDGTVIVRVSGHEGEWSKTSETALRRAVVGVDGVDELTDSDGGYETDSE